MKELIETNKNTLEKDIHTIKDFPNISHIYIFYNKEKKIFFDSLYRIENLLKDQKEKLDMCIEVLKNIDIMDCQNASESTGVPIEEFIDDYAGPKTISGICRETLKKLENE